jgi:cell division protein FtsI (penicillin-binding protein 3)
MMKTNNTAAVYNTRYLIIVVGFLCVLFAVAGRLAYLHVLKKDFLRSQGEARTVREIKIAAYRGMIKDRNGESLAISTPVDSVWINPQKIDVADPKLNSQLQQNHQRVCVPKKAG